MRNNHGLITKTGFVCTAQGKTRAQNNYFFSLPNVQRIFRRSCLLHASFTFVFICVHLHFVHRRTCPRGCDLMPSPNLESVAVLYHKMRIILLLCWYCGDRGNSIVRENIYSPVACVRLGHWCRLLNSQQDRMKGRT